MIFLWSGKSLERLTQMWADGSSASEIAKELRVPTRNIVIGKIHRLGLTRNPTGKAVEAKRRSRPRAKRRAPWAAPVLAIPLPVEPEVVVVAEPVLQSTGPITLAELAAHHCRWPIGDPQAADFHYCGAYKIADSSYCNAHHMLAYAPAPRKTTLSQEERVRRQRMERTGSARAFS